MVFLYLAIGLLTQRVIKLDRTALNCFFVSARHNFCSSYLVVIILINYCALFL
jgi:hypothetical protein